VDKNVRIWLNRPQRYTGILPEHQDAGAGGGSLLKGKA